MNVAILETGLFPDSETVLDALNHLEPVHYVYRYDLRKPIPSAEEWDQLIDALCTSDRIISV
ncbi:MAG TPA: hypothetical protein DEP05_02325 [Betaproteobacteria bacterium]|nr:hypothetical protein [Betaproteobacteria bacterium]